MLDSNNQAQLVMLLQELLSGGGQPGQLPMPDQSGQVPPPQPPPNMQAPPPGMGQLPPPPPQMPMQDPSFPGPGQPGFNPQSSIPQIAYTPQPDPMGGMPPGGMPGGMGSPQMDPQMMEAIMRMISGQRGMPSAPTAPPPRRVNGAVY